ncbi:MAG: tail fiber domain-containing protein, partial [Eubacteriales bacterium]|nr:tail fiber domain-containing protein [Eubacteriales bacterium]
GIKYGVVIDTKSFRPCGNGSSVISDAFNTRCAPLNLGLSNHRWANIYAASSTIITSDKNEKHDISDITRELAKSIILGVQPKAYKYNDGTSGRTHYGIISQDIEQLLNDLHLSSLDFAGFVKSPKLKEYVVDVLDDNGEAVLNSDGTPLTEIKTEEIEGEYIYSLRYEEFISPLIKVVQEHEKEIEELKNKNTELENKYNDLLSRIEKLENAEGSN